MKSDKKIKGRAAHKCELQKEGATRSNPVFTATKAAHENERYNQEDRRELKIESTKIKKFLHEIESLLFSHCSSQRAERRERRRDWKAKKALTVGAQKSKAVSAL